MESTTYALPATPKQIAYARALALRNQTLLPWEVQQDLRAQRLDRRASQTEAGYARQPPDIKAGRLRRTSRPHQTPRRAG